jgi:hypothetical protein
MSPTPEELELGAKAYKQVRFYENVTVKDIRQTPWMYVILAALLFLSLVSEAHFKWRENLPLLFLIPAFFAIRLWQNRAAKINYSTNNLLLQLLEEKHGDALPWVIEEKQLARARELEAKIAQGQTPASHA